MPLGPQQNKGLIFDQVEKDQRNKQNYFLCFSSRPKHASCLQNQVRTPFGNIFLCSVILPNPPSFISSFARLVSGFTQSSGWNTYLAWSASVFFLKQRRHVSLWMMLDVQSCGAQPFWYQGLILWKTIFPWIGGEGGGLRMIQVHYIYCALLLVSR